MAKYLTKDQILSAEDRESTEVEVPEWGGTVRIMAPSAWELSEYQSSQIKVEFDKQGNPQRRVDMTGADVRLAAMCIVDDEGERMFSEKELKKLGQKSSKALDRVVRAIRELRGMDEELGVAEGNSE